MNEFSDDGHCFVCGPQNPIGLKLKFTPVADGGGSEASVVFPGHFQGWEGVVHGGLISTVLDEMAIQAAGHRGIKCVTAELTVRFVKPAKTETPYRLEGSVTEDRGRIVMADSRLLDEGGKEIARATARLFRVNSC